MPTPNRTHNERAATVGTWGLTLGSTLVASGLLLLTALLLPGCARDSAVQAENREVRLTRGEGLKFRPKFSPDGTKVVYTVRGEDGGLAIYWVPADEGAEPRKIPSGSQEDMALSWGDHGKTVYVFNYTDGFVRRVDLEGKIIETVSPIEIARVDDISRDSERLLYCQFNGDNWDIGVRRMDDTADLELLAETPAWEVGGCFGPGEDEITVVSQAAYGASESEISIFSEKAGKFDRIALPAGRNEHPTWSSAGDYLAFSSNRQGTRDLWLWKRATDQLAQVTHVADDDARPHWSPDEDWLVFSRRTVVSNLYVGDPETQDVRRLTDGEARDSNPMVSPDGEWVAFARELVSEGNLGPRKRVLCVASVEDGTVTQFDLGKLDVRLGEESFSWSPDSREIALSADDGTGNIDVYRVSIEDRRPVRVTIELGADLMPKWSPDGGTLAYTRPAGGETQVWTIPAHGGLPRQLTSNEGVNQAPVWGPDSDLIAYMSIQPDMQYQLWVTSLRNTDYAHLMPLDERVVIPIAWSAKGDEVIVWSKDEGEDGSYSMYAVRVDGSGRRKIGSMGAADKFVDFTSQGEWYMDQVYPGGVHVYSDGKDVSDIYMVRVGDLLSSPGWNRKLSTVPAAGARMVCSIFIASMISRGWLAATLSPGATSRLTTVPFIGAFRLPAPAVASCSPVSGRSSAKCTAPPGR